MKGEPEIKKIKKEEIEMSQNEAAYDLEKTCGLHPSVAMSVVKAIARGDISGVKIHY